MQEHVYPNIVDIVDQLSSGAELPPADEDDNGVNWCAELIKVWYQAPHTTAWRAGRRLVPGLPLVPGTAIATFDANGRFPQNGIAHAAIFVRYTRNGDGIVVVDQWRERSTLQYRSLAWERVDADPHVSYVNSAKNFFTITW
ncbi:BPSL0067 family protein [Lysobacter firmicutimachus]|uniref:BPSL0067 family protein n=1 Tax=Lysobacter firmicutimachus TaxID=1792846 RepID=A0ABU8D0L5_9GAMM